MNIVPEDEAKELQWKCPKIIPNKNWEKYFTNLNIINWDDKHRNLLAFCVLAGNITIDSQNLQIIATEVNLPLQLFPEKVKIEYFNPFVSKNKDNNWQIEHIMLYAESISFACSYLASGKISANEVNELRLTAWQQDASGMADFTLNIFEEEIDEAFKYFLISPPNIKNSAALEEWLVRQGFMIDRISDDKLEELFGYLKYLKKHSKSQEIYSIERKIIDKWNN